MNDVYTYRHSGRRPLMWLLLAIGLGFTAVWVSGRGPTFGYVILGGYLGLVLATLIWNPQHGLTITDRDVIIAPLIDARHVPLAEIDYVRIDLRSERSDFDLILKNGRRVRMYAINVPSPRKITKLFEARGIPVRRL